MHSLKNTVVAIMLLGVTYGVYQALTTPDPTVANNSDDFLDSMIEDFPARDDTQMSMDRKGLENANPILPELLNSKGDSNAFAPPKAMQTPPPTAASLNDNALMNSLKQTISGSENRGTSGFQPSTANMIPIQRPAISGSLASNANQNNREQFATKNENGLFDPSVQKAGSSSPITLDSAWPQIRSMVEQGEFRAALVSLSRFYHDESLGQNERSEMLNWLDQLAAKVIYSNEHHLRSTPYIIQPNDTILDLSEKWNVPAQLIYNINQNKIPNWNDIPAGVELKMISGPFHAEIDSVEKTMTLFVKNLYAGRFAIETGSLATAQSGVYPVVSKKAKGNPLGSHWIGLKNGSSLHASSNMGSDSSFSLDAKQAQEVFAILGKNSTVEILR